MGSFVPFGGFFSTTSDFQRPFSRINQSFTRCKLCTENYEQEAAVVRKGGSTISVVDQCSEIVPWLRMAELDTGKRVDVAKVCNSSKFDFYDAGIHMYVLSHPHGQFNASVATGLKILG